MLISEFVQLSGSGGFSGVAYHCYAGEVDAMNVFHNAHPTSDIWFSESFACLVCGCRLMDMKLSVLGWSEVTGGAIFNGKQATFG